jgi:hypothetical protein
MQPQSENSIFLVLWLTLLFLSDQFAAARVPPFSTTASVAARDLSTAVCTAAKPCQGDITYFETGLGACGVTNNGTVDRVVALPHVMMGALSNNNPYCGQTITIHCVATGKRTTATVVDKCMGCEGFAIDLSRIAFEDLDDLAVGRTSANWWFN